MIAMAFSSYAANAYAANASKIYLESLAIDYLFRVSCKAMADWIPSLTHLRELNISFIDFGVKEIAAQLIESVSTIN
jgi:hypothetical protein